MPFRFKFHPNGRNSDRPSGDNRVESGLAPVSMLPNERNVRAWVHLGTDFERRY